MRRFAIARIAHDHPGLIESMHIDPHAGAKSTTRGRRATGDALEGVFRQIER